MSRLKITFFSPSILFFWIFLSTTNGHGQLVDTSYYPPKPIITIHSGHIGLQDQLLITDYTGTIIPGEPYTLDIYMGNTDRFDYVIERCLYNDRTSFIDNYGCLRRNEMFLTKWETNDYTLPGALKRTLVHFVATEPIVRFQCDIKLIECCGCAEESCERQPAFGFYPVYPMPIFCTYPNNPGAVLPPIGGGAVPGGGFYPRNGYYNGDHFWSGIPWWLWLLLLLLLLLLLCLLVCAVCCCLGRKKRSDKSDQGKTTIVKRSSQVHPSPSPPSILKPAPALPTKPLVIDTSIQAVPKGHSHETTQQINVSNGRSSSVDSRNRNEKLTSATATATSTAARASRRNERTATTHHHNRHRSSSTNNTQNHGIKLVDGPFYSENSGTIVQTNYSKGQLPGYIKDRNRYEEDYVNLDQGSRFRQYNAVPVHRATSRRQQDEFQHEIEERIKREQKKQELELRIENHLSEHREHREHTERRHAFSPTGESMREETYRTMRQSSVI